MRILTGAVLAATLIVTNAFAADTTGPLAAGKPAGVQKAQSEDHTVLYVLGGAVIIGGIAPLASSNGGNGSNNGSPAGGGSGGTSGSSP